MRSKPSANSTQNAPNAAQKRWIQTVAGLGPLGNYGHVELDHFLGGATIQIKGIGNIGHWAIIPISTEDHRIRTLKGRKAFEEATGKTAKGMFIEVCKRIEDLPFNVEIYNAILDYHK